MTTRKTILTPFARISFPKLFKPEANMQGVLQYSCVLLFPKDFDSAGKRLGLPPAIVAEAPNALKAMKALAAEVAIEFFAGKDKIPPGIRSQDLGKSSGWPFRDQGQRSGDGYEEGALFVSLSSKQKPTVLDRNKAEIFDESLVYPGCWVRASVTAYGYNANGNKGISFGLGNIQKLCDDDNLTGRGNAQDEFTAIGGSDDNSESAEALFG